MTDLSQDELTVLLIAAKGESLAAIGRWEVPIDSLVEKGLLSRGDKFNNFITPAGRVAAKKGEDANYVAMLETGTKINNARTVAQQLVAQVAHHLLIAARALSQVTGGSLQNSVDQCSIEALRKVWSVLDGSPSS